MRTNRVSSRLRIANRGGQVILRLVMVLAPVMGSAHTMNPSSGWPSVVWAPVAKYLVTSMMRCSPTHLESMIDHMKTRRKKWVVGVRILNSAVQEDALACVNWLIVHGYTEAIIGKHLSDKYAIDAATIGWSCSTRMIRLLVRHGANPRSSLALAGAAILGKYRCVRLLLKLGANVNGPNSFVSPLSAAINLAARTGHLRILILLLRWGANPNQGTVYPPLFHADGLDALHLYCLSCMRALLQVGANPNAVDANGQSVLLWSLQAGHKTPIKMIRTLVRGGANVNLPNSKTGETPLMAAAARGNEEVIVYLLEHGADRCAHDNHGRTAAVYARGTRHEKLARLLVCRSQS